jgi:hypothetical protein
MQQQESQSAQKAIPSATPAAPVSKTASIGAAADAARQSQARHEMARSAISNERVAPAATARPELAEGPAVAAGASGSRAGAGNAAVGAFAPHSAEQTKTIAAKWSISSDGQLVRKVAGEEPQTIKVADNVRFRAVASIRSEVWAGGPGGALYHSSDNGATWNAVSFLSTQDIVAIAFRNSREGTITVASGEHYVTRDGGQSWQQGNDL